MSFFDTNDDKKGNETKQDDHDRENHEELVDPRVQVELERLNTATDLINKLEIELDEARSNFRLLLSESSIRVNQLAKKLGASVEKARPYYEARMHAKQLQTQTQKAALRYERASSAHSAAKEMVFLAEEGLKKEGRCFDPAWQEMLNHATLRVNEAESERVLSQREHQKTSLAYNEAEKIVQHLHQELKKSIVKSSLSTRRSLLQLNNLANQHQLQLLPYFEMKAQFNQLLEEQRRKVHHLEENILKMKMSYADALHNLEEISDEIHEKRKCESGTLSDRSEILGAESNHFSRDNVKSYHKMKSSSMSSENVYIENLNSEDVYMSLPSKLTLRPGIIAASCKGNNSEKNPCLPQQEPPAEESRDKIRNMNSASKNNDFHHNTMNKLTEDNYSSQVTSDSSTPISNQLERLNVSNKDDDYEENKSNGTLDSFSEVGELPACDYKFLAPDFNLLRVQREEISDSESLASNETTDTLDDNQIECLLLEKVLPLDVHETNTENSFNSYAPKGDIHL